MSSCLSESELRRFRSGDLVQDEAARAEAHLAACASCAERDRVIFAAHDEMLRNLRGVAGGISIGGTDSPPRAGQETGDVPVSVRTAAGRSKVGERIGPYQLVRVLGEGGFGTVFLADQERPVRRRVALKVLKAGMDSAEIVSRFEAERQALAMMNHPSVAAVYDGGTTPDGRSFFVMEHVPGESIIDYCDHKRLSIEDRLALFIQVCAAVQHAHQKGIIHRDLKPSNILVTVHDGAALPKVIDFGVAKARGGPPGDVSMHTQEGVMIGTPEYMSPEQFEGASQDIDTRADIYALGVVLYELLAGIPPFDFRSMRRAGISEIMRVVREEEAPAPSTKIGRMRAEAAALAEKRGTEARSLARALRGDLDWIVLRCLEKDRGRRYESAGELALEIRRHLANQPVTAGPPSRSYRIRKFVRRHRGGVIAAGLLAVTIVGAVTGMAMLSAWALREKDRAETALIAEAEQRKLAEQRQKETEEVADFQSKMLSEIDVEAMGRGIKEQFRAQVQASLERQYVGRDAERRKRTAEEVESDLSAYDQRAATAQAVDVARRVMDEYVLGRAEKVLEKEFADKPLTMARLRSALGIAYLALAIYEPAERNLQSALDIELREKGGDHPDTLASINNMGHFLVTQGKFAEAEPYWREALEKRRRVLGDDDKDTVQSVSNIGYLLMQQGKAAEAERYLRDALDGFRRTRGDDHTDTLTAINNVGFVLQAQGKFAEAEPYHREALERCRRVLGDDHPETLAAANNLGFLLGRLHRYEEAEGYCRTALEGCRRVLGDDHPRTLTLINNIGSLIQARGNLAEAESYHREALERRRRVFGDDHPDTLGSIYNMAYLLQVQERYSEAERFNREALAGFRRALGAEHPHALYPIHTMGDLCRAQGRLDEAEQNYREALAARRRILGNAHPDTFRTYHELAGLLLQMRRFEEAEKLSLEAATWLESLSPAHLLRPRVLENIANLYDAWDAAESGKGYDEKAAAWRAKLDAWRATTQPAAVPPSPATAPAP